MSVHLCPLCSAQIACDDTDLADDDSLFAFDGMPRALVDHVRTHLTEMAIPAKPTLANIASLPADQLVEMAWGSTGFDPGSVREIFWQVELINLEVSNGGLVQYFQNTRGENIDDAIAALLALGAHRHLRVFERAVAAYREERAQPDGCWAEDLGNRPYQESRIKDMDNAAEWDVDACIELEAAWIRAHARDFATDD